MGGGGGGGLGKKKAGAIKGSGRGIWVGNGGWTAGGRIKGGG